MFNTRHALPLRSRRIVRPRSGRGTFAEYPQEWTAIRPYPHPVRVLIQVAARPVPGFGHSRAQSVPVFFSEPHPRPQPVLVHYHIKSVPVPARSAIATLFCPGSKRRRVRSLPVERLNSRPLNEHI